MNYYALALYSHFLGLVALFVGYGLEWTASSKLRRAATADEARTWLGLYRGSLPLSGPGLLLLILSGGYLASLTGSMRQGWMSASLLAIVLAFVMSAMAMRLVPSESIRWEPTCVKFHETDCYRILTLSDLTKAPPHP